MRVDRNKLTQATIEVLQNDFESEIFTKESYAKKLKEIIEEYAKKRNLSKFIKIFVQTLTEDELAYLVRTFINEYDNI